MVATHAFAMAACRDDLAEIARTPPQAATRGRILRRRPLYARRPPGPGAPRSEAPRCIVLTGSTLTSCCSMS
jgi:hypothetical protein